MNKYRVTERVKPQRVQSVLADWYTVESNGVLSFWENSNSGARRVASYASDVWYIVNTTSKDLTCTHK